ncbi:hypothetical protein GCM10022419_135770 [Nonomuraea rosea]|uniref:DUF397 domain-containing protein n=1 Tax=Nonomuraea rosea TaxID=638574 RepID=A0ABP7A925_9ACTN
MVAVTAYPDGMAEPCAFLVEDDDVSLKGGDLGVGERSDTAVAVQQFGGTRSLKTHRTGFG